MSNLDFTGPHISAAFLCEKVLVEPGNVPTFVRVVDRFTIPKFSGTLPPGVQLPPQQPLQFTLVVMLKSGDLGAGSHPLIIKLQKPDKTYASTVEASIFFQGGDDNGAMIMTPIGLPAPDEGLHWFDVLFEGELITRISLRVLFQPAVLQMQLPPAPGGD
jgi:hypothetical protein